MLCGQVHPLTQRGHCPGLEVLTLHSYRCMVPWVCFSHLCLKGLLRHKCCILTQSF